MSLLRSRYKFSPLSIEYKTELSKRRRKFYNTEVKLKAKKEEQENKRHQYDDMWEEIAVEGQLLRENAVAFNKFIIVNKKKRERAEGILEFNKNLIKEREDDIKNLQEKIADLKDTKEKLDGELASLSIYQDYLNNYLTHFGTAYNLKCVDDVVTRYESYIELKNEVISERVKLLKFMEMLKSDIVVLTAAGRDKLISFHVKAHTLREKYKNAYGKSRRLDVLVSDTISKIREKYVDLTTTKEAINNLYLQMCERRYIKPKYSNDPQQQLTFIKRTLELYEQLITKNRKPPKSMFIKRAK